MLALLSPFPVGHIRPCDTDSFLFCLSNIVQASALCQLLSLPEKVPALMEEALWCRGGLTRMIGMICVGKVACWLLRNSDVQASLPEGITVVQRGPALPAQAGCQITAAELGPQLQLPRHRVQFGLRPEGGTMVTFIRPPCSISTWGSCSKPVLSSTVPHEPAPGKSSLGREVLPCPAG